MSRTIKAESTARTGRPARAEILQRIQQREQAWQDRSEILPILRR
jgi:hypothetical protein